MLNSLGKVTVTTSGTPVRVTSGQTTPSAHIAAQGAVIQTLSTNSGKIYVGISTLNKSTLVGILFTLGVPGVGSSPSFSVSQLSTAGLGLEDIWIDADNSGEGVTVGYVQG